MVVRFVEFVFSIAGHHRELSRRTAFVLHCVDYARAICLLLVSPAQRTKNGSCGAAAQRKSQVAARRYVEII
jgi:hypothetical protein